jgi:hypothetical protein
MGVNLIFRRQQEKGVMAGDELAIYIWSHHRHVGAAQQDVTVNDEEGAVVEPRPSQRETADRAGTATTTPASRVPKGNR